MQEPADAGCSLPNIESGRAGDNGFIHRTTQVAVSDHAASRLPHAFPEGSICQKNLFKSND
jgi:hypothetical protein